MNSNRTYQSPFSWRYGSPEMRENWSEYHTRILWRRLWISLAVVQERFQLVSSEQIKELKKRATDVDLERSLEIEAIVEHDLMAELKVFADQCPAAGGSLHLGATSMDIKDNARILQIKAGMNLLVTKLTELLELFSTFIERWADLPLIGFTHLQPAEPTTLGFRFSQTAQDLMVCYDRLIALEKEIKSKGFSGAVGTSASFAQLIGEDNLGDFHQQLSDQIGVDFFLVSTQTYPRIQDFQILSQLAEIAAVIYKFAFDLRILQSPGFGEIAEPFGTKQVGSSAMPFKQNPIKAEKLNSLGRYLAQLPRIAWDNAAHSLLERTMDDSANRRVILPEAFLATDEMLQTCREILDGLQINQIGIAENLARYAPFAATEQVLMLACKAGADRQHIHQVLRGYSLQAWKALQNGEDNPLEDLLSEDSVLLEYLNKDEIQRVLRHSAHFGDAVHKSTQLAADIRKKIQD